MEAGEIIFLGVSGLIGVIAVILTYTRFRYSWIVFVIAFPWLYLGIFYPRIEGLRGQPLYAVIFILLFATSVFAVIRWYYKRPHKNTHIYTIVLLLILCSQFPLYNRYKEGADRARCILQMITFNKLVYSYSGMNEIHYWDVIDTSEIFNNYLSGEPVCPSGGRYEWAKFFHKEPTPLVACSIPKHHLAFDVESVEGKPQTRPRMRVVLHKMFDANSGELSGNIGGQDKKLNEKEVKIVTLALKTATFTRWASVGEEFLTSATPSVYYFKFLHPSNNGDNSAMLSGDGKTLMWNASVFELSDEAAQQLLEVFNKPGWK